MNWTDFKQELEGATCREKPEKGIRGKAITKIIINIIKKTKQKKTKNMRNIK